MNETIIRNFCQAHGIIVLDRNKRVERYHKVYQQYFTNPEDYNWVGQQVMFESETLYTVEIAESELERISSFESQVFNHMKQTGHYDMFNSLMQQKEHEKYLKEKYPAVRKAYEQYSLMLKMAESGEL